MRIRLNRTGSQIFSALAIGGVCLFAPAAFCQLQPDTAKMPHKPAAVDEDEPAGNEPRPAVEIHKKASSASARTKEKPDADQDKLDTKMYSPLDDPEELTSTEDASSAMAAVDPVPHYKNALKLTQEKQYNLALGELKKALEQNPNYLQARYQRAFVHQLMGKTELAIKEYRLYLTVKPEDSQAHVNLGILLKNSQDLSGAAEQFKKAVETNFYSFPAHYDLANLLVDQGKLDDALKEYKVCMKLKPNNAMVHNNVGVIYQRRNYLEEAEQEFRKAWHLEPSNKVFQANLDVIRQLMKKGA